MNVANGVRPPHLADEDLLRHIDRQQDLEGSRRVRAHLSLCEECTERAERLREESRTLSALFGEMDEQPDPSRRAGALAAAQAAQLQARRRRVPARWSSAPLRAAAVVAVMMLGAFSTPPVRAWMGERVEEMVGPNPGAVGSVLLDWLGQDEAPAAEAAPAAPAAPAEAAPEAPVAEAVPSGGAPAAAPAVRGASTTAPVAFSGVAGGEVVVEFASVQAAGTLRLVVRDLPAATARVTGAGRGEGLAPVAGGMRIGNTAASRAAYEVAVPTRYRRVRVRVPGSEDRVYEVSPQRRGWTWEIGLQPDANP